MPRALVCINLESESGEVVKDLKKIDGVREVYSSKGMYEAIAIVQADSFDKLKEIVSQQVRNIVDVKSTLTLTLIDENLSHKTSNAMANYELLRKGFSKQHTASRFCRCRTAL